MRKFIVFDTDQSLSSIGGPGVLKETFGVPPVPISFGLDQLMYYLAGQNNPNPLIVKEEEVEHHPLLGDLPLGVKYRLSPQARDLGVTGIIIDTISTLGYQTREKLQRDNKTQSMTRDLWGLYGDKMMRFFHLLKEGDFPVIVTCHISRDQDEMGGPLDLPDIKGQAKEGAARYFDVIAYTRVDRNNKGQIQYSWQVKPDSRRIFAKDRLGVIEEPYVEQDLSVVFSGYEAAGIEKPKILILGDSGQGKTYSLKTINGGDEQ